MAEFSKPEDLERWLRGKPHEFAVVLAARAALRLAPQLVSLLDRGSDEEVSYRRILLILRAMAAPWVTATYPARAPELLVATAAAADAAHNGGGAGIIALAAAEAAASVITGGTSHAVLAIRHSVSVADQTDAWETVSADATALERGLRPSALAGEPLWLYGIPNWTFEDWKSLKQRLLNRGENWKVWVDWYDARLAGHRASPPIVAIQMARVLIPDETWNQGPKVVNSEIGRIIAAHSKPKPPQQREAERPDGEPQIPVQRPAALEPVWDGNILTIPAQPVAVDLQRADFPAALKSLRLGLEKLADDLDGETNIDLRFVAYLRQLAEKIRDAVPPQHELFELGHAEEVLKKYAAVINSEWPNILAARYHGLIMQHDNTMRQAPAWREFKRNALSDTITPVQVAEAAPVAAEFAASLRDDLARKFVDPILPVVLDNLAEPLRETKAYGRHDLLAEIEAGKELLALDVIESINNTLKPLAEKALATCVAVGDVANKFGSGVNEGALEGASEEGKKYGKRIIKWLCAAGAGGASIGLGKLIATYPDAFGWLGSVIQFLSKLPML